MPRRGLSDAWPSMRSAPLNAMFRCATPSATKLHGLASRSTAGSGRCCCAPADAAVRRAGLAPGRNYAARKPARLRWLSTALQVRSCWPTPWWKTCACRGLTPAGSCARGASRLNISSWHAWWPGAAQLPAERAGGHCAGQAVAPATAATCRRHRTGGAAGRLPYGDLFRLPFQVLAFGAPSHVLGTRHAVSYLPAAGL